MVLAFPVDPNKTAQVDWLPFKVAGVMYTDGIKTSGFIRGHPIRKL